MEETVRQSFLPVSVSHSPLIFHRLLQHCFTLQISVNNDEDSSSEEEDSESSKRKMFLIKFW